MSAVSPRPFVGPRLLLLCLVCVTSCSPFGQNPAATKQPPPGTIKGNIVFQPEDTATELDPAKTEVKVKPLNSDTELKTVSVKSDTGTDVAVNLQNGEASLKGELGTDTHYTVTATAVVHHKGAADEPETEVTAFSTATTPKIVATNPQSVGKGQSVVLTLAPAASDVSVIDGPVDAQLGPDGTTVTLLPKSYTQGQTYSLTLVAKNKAGIAGQPQQATFNTLPPGTAAASPDSGSTNIGVAYPITVTLSGPPADRAALLNKLTVTVDGSAPASAGTGGCAQYGTSAVPSGPIATNASWLSDRKVKLTPKTPDGYWPAKSTVSLKGTIQGLTSNTGSVFEGNVSTSFTTADKRVVDVDLSKQQLTTCKNGVQDQQFLISSGTPSHPTYTGSFYIWRRVADEEMKSPEGPFAPDYYDIKHVPWTQYFDGSAALHGAWWHNSFGTPRSHGCVNVQSPTNNTQWPKALPQAEYLWGFNNLGDPVLVHGVTPGLSAASQPSD
ncbi:MAG: L,D-transpeptidase family protein [Candidatus Dormiibacterota bacterium]